MKNILLLLAFGLIVAPSFAQLKLDREPPRISLKTIDQPGFGGHYSIAPPPDVMGTSCRERSFLGAMIGISLFTDVPDEGGYWGYRMGMALTLMAMYELSPNLSLIGTLGLLQMGYVQNNQNYSERWRRNYLAAGLLLGYMFPVQSVQLGLLAGPMLGYWLCTSSVFVDNISGEKNRQKEDFHNFPGQEVKRLLLGAAGGVMLRTNCGPGAFMGMALLNYGITPHKRYTYLNGEVYTRHNLGFTFRLGYAIALSQLCNGNGATVE